MIPKDVQGNLLILLNSILHSASSTNSMKHWWWTALFVCGSSSETELFRVLCDVHL